MIADYCGEFPTPDMAGAVTFSALGATRLRAGGALAVSIGSMPAGAVQGVGAGAAGHGRVLAGPQGKVCSAIGQRHHGRTLGDMNGIGACGAVDDDDAAFGGDGGHGGVDDHGAVQGQKRHDHAAGVMLDGDSAVFDDKGNNGIGAHMNLTGLPGEVGLAALQGANGAAGTDCIAIGQFVPVSVDQLQHRAPGLADDPADLLRRGGTGGQQEGQQRQRARPNAGNVSARDDILHGFMVPPGTHVRSATGHP